MGLIFTHRFFCLMTRWLCVLALLVLTVVQPTVMVGAYAQHPSADQNVSQEHGAASASESQSAHPGHSWEVSPQGIAYSQFNHRFAGWCALLIGLSELGRTLRFFPPRWTRIVLSGAFGAVGVFLLIWSDHDAWPIGSLSFVQTFTGQDLEILQHKFYGVFAATVAVSEFLRGIGLARHPAWGAPLILYVVIGGATLFVHSHGTHLGAHTIELQHAIMGTLAISGGVSQSVAAWLTSLSNSSATRWEFIWVGHIFLVAAQLILYFE
jgi:putative copper resistance protein D